MHEITLVINYQENVLMFTFFVVLTVIVIIIMIIITLLHEQEPRAEGSSNLERDLGDYRDAEHSGRCD